MSIPFRRVRRPIILFLGLALPVLFPPVARSLNLVRAEVRADLATSTFGVTGQGVIVAILDRGIDWKSADFRKANGDTRIDRIFDLTDDTGAFDFDNPYGMGTIYTRAEIDLALDNNTPLATRDAVGHGTTTAGIACGGGRNAPVGKYKGIAPNADLIVVKVTSDGAPAHDSEPAEDPYYDITRLPVAIDFVRDRAAALGQPAVMLLNLGSAIGPTDGTGSLCRHIDATVGPSIPGLVFVSGAGDDGGIANHAGGNVPAGGGLDIDLHKASTYPLFLDLWYPDTDRFDVTLTTPNVVAGPFTSPSGNSDYDIQSDSDYLYYQLGSDIDFYEALNNKREIWIRLDGPVGDYTVHLDGSVVTTGRFDVTMNPSQIWASPQDGNVFLNHVVPGSIWDGATSQYGICPNSYVIRTSWVDIDGFTRFFTGEGNVNERWHGSSVGPTFDGRYGVDVSAPGDRIMTTYNPASWWATFRFNLVNDGAGLYGTAGAVSAASPIVTGAIALMLQRNPALTAPGVKTILHQSARHDSFTGATPNNNWGYGKLDAYQAVNLSTGPSAAPEPGDRKPDLAWAGGFINPIRSSASMEYSLPKAGDVTARVFDPAGRLVSTLFDGAAPAGRSRLNWNAAGSGPGVYLLQVTAGRETITRKIVRTP